MLSNWSVRSLDISPLWLVASSISIKFTISLPESIIDISEEAINSNLARKSPILSCSQSLSSKRSFKRAKSSWLSLKNISRNKKNDSLLNYFINPQTQELDKEKILATLSTLQNKDYLLADSSSREVIEQLVINRIVNKQLAAKQEAKTRKIFNKIKDNWVNFVTVVPTPSQFAINSVNLETELSKITSSSSNHKDNLSIGLLAKREYNLDLLQNAILALAFRYQNLNIETIRIDIISHAKLKGNGLIMCIRRLLQMDMKPFVFLNKREIGYGIEYVIRKNTLHFRGQLTYDLADDTIIVHLTNNRGRILRVITLTGEPKDINDSHASLMEDVSIAF